MRIMAVASRPPKLLDALVSVMKSTAIAASIPAKCGRPISEMAVFFASVWLRIRLLVYWSIQLTAKYHC
jgi:hypothetical protein